MPQAHKHEACHAMLKNRRKKQRTTSPFLLKKKNEKVRCNADLMLGATTSSTSYVLSGTQNHDLSSVIFIPVLDLWAQTYSLQILVYHGHPTKSTK